MTSFVTASFTVTSNLSEYESDFFHLDAEFFHTMIDSAQVISFDKTTKQCVVELFCEDDFLVGFDFQACIKDEPISVSIDNMEIKYTAMQIS